VRIPCIIDAKALEMANFSKTGSRNMAEMRNQFLDPGLLFDFYSDIGSTATPSALSNYSRAGLSKFRAKSTKCGFRVQRSKFEHPSLPRRTS